MLATKWSSFVDQQHREPHGLVGRFIGERMLRQHKPETDWSIDLLQLQPTDRVLEIGFGAGRALALATQVVSNGSVIGIDRSPAMLRTAQLRNRAAVQAGRITLLKADLATLPFVNSYFDKIFSIHTFYFWPDPLACCYELLQMLAPAGRVVITFATAETLPSGERNYWPIHEQAELLVQQLASIPDCRANLAIRPDSRQFNNIAIVLDKIGVGAVA